LFALLLVVALHVFGVDLFD